MKTYKKWCISIIAVVISILIICSTVVVVIDPFFLYHKPIESIAYNYDDPFYQNVGLIKNEDYETLIIGTSIIQNFRVSSTEKTFGTKAIKTPFCGSDASRIVKAIDLAVDKQENLNQIIMNLDFLFDEDNGDEFSNTDYTYDDNVFNDVQYIFNETVLVEKAGGAILNTITKTDTKKDLMFSSEKQFNFGESVVFQKNLPEEHDSEKMKTAFAKNVKLLIEEVIIPNKQIHFDLFIPPKSIMYLKELSDSGVMDSFLTMYKELAVQLFELSNVSLYCFQIDSNTICNLYNYCDTIHFSCIVSDLLGNYIKNGTYELNIENYNDMIDEIKKIQNNFDYSVFDSNKFEIKRETNFIKYLEILKNGNYVVACSNKGKDAYSISDDFAATVSDYGYSIGPENIIENGIYTTGNTSEKEFGFQIGENGSVIANNVEYAVERDGVNIVVYDKKLKRVIDSVSFKGKNLSECQRNKIVRID